MNKPAQDKAYYSLNSERIRKRVSEYYETNKDMINMSRRDRFSSDIEYRAKKQAADREYYRRVRTESSKFRFRVYKDSAKKRGIPFLISFEEFCSLIGRQCHYCGLESKANGIDRIDSDFGYANGNLVSACAKCNWAKRDMSSLDFIGMCRSVSARFPS